MKERTVYQKLEHYCDSLSKDKAYKERTKKDWMFGAIDFAHNASLITVEEFDELWKKYTLE